MEEDAAIRVVLVRPPGTKFPARSFWQKSWERSKEQFTSLLSYCLLGGFILIVWCGWRTFFAKTVLVISPFSVPAGGEPPIALSGQGAANLLLDKLIELSREANEFGKGVTNPYLNTERREEMPEVKVEVAGFSIEGVVAAASRILEKQQVVTGEVYWTREGILIRSRLEDDVWTVGPFPGTATDLEKQYRVLAKDVLSITNPNIAGLILQKDGEISLAQRSYRSWLSLRGLDANSRAQGNFHLGVTFDQSQDRARAEQSYKSAIAIQPNFYEALVNLAIDLSADGQGKEAIEKLKQASDLKPNSLAPLMIMGVIQSDPVEKEKTYRRALKLYPDMPEVHYQLSLVLKQQNRQVEADQEYQSFTALKAAQTKTEQGKAPQIGAPESKTSAPAIQGKPPK